VKEISSREFMDNLTSLFNASGPAAVNDDVKQKILELIQSWAVASEGRADLSYINEVYKTLQQEGHRFPPRQDIASSMFDSSAVSTSHFCQFCRRESAKHVFRCSPQNGQTQMSACDVERLSRLRIGNTIAGIVVMYSAEHARARLCLCRT